jgi:hypothetical protein
MDVGEKNVIGTDVCTYSVLKIAIVWVYVPVCMALSVFRTLRADKTALETVLGKSGLAQN